MDSLLLTVRGSFRGPSGHDHHVREFVRELHRRGVGIELVDVPHWSPAKLPPKMRDPLFESLTIESLTQPVDSRIALHFTMPHQVACYPAKFNVNFTMFEADRVLPEWVRDNLKHDLLIVPSESSKRAWIRSGMPAHRIRLCPLGVDPSVFSGNATPLPLAVDRSAENPPPSQQTGAGGEPIYRVRFLNVSEWGPRKNLPGLLEAWTEATTQRDDVILIVKLGCYAPGAREQLDALRGRLRTAAPVLFVLDVLAAADMPRLYAAATHYISMSFGEGWDQPMMEAAASGLKLIAPDHSAYTAWLDSSIASLIPSQEVDAVHDGDPRTAELFRGARWWQPDHAKAVACIRAAIDGRDGDLASPRERIARDFTWEKATTRLIEILSELSSLKETLRFVSMLRSSKSAALTQKPPPPTGPLKPDP